MVDQVAHDTQATENEQQCLKRLNFLEDGVRSGAPVVGEYYTYVKGKMGPLQSRIEKVGPRSSSRIHSASSRNFMIGCASVLADGRSCQAILGAVGQALLQERDIGENRRDRRQCDPVGLCILERLSKGSGTGVWNRCELRKRQEQARVCVCVKESFDASEVVESVSLRDRRSRTASART